MLQEFFSSKSYFIHIKGYYMRLEPTNQIMTNYTMQNIEH